MSDTKYDHKKNAPPDEEKEFWEELDSLNFDDGLAGLEEMSMPPLKKEELLKELQEEEQILDELPLEDSGNPELDRDLLQKLSETHFRGSLDVDTDRAYKGITSTMDRISFEKKEKNLFSESGNPTDDTKQEKAYVHTKDEDVPEPDDIQEREPDSEPELEEDEEAPPKKKRKRRANPSNAKETPPVVRPSWEEHELDEADSVFNDEITRYYQNLGKKNDGPENNWEEGLVSLIPFEEKEEEPLEKKINDDEDLGRSKRHIKVSRNQSLLDDEREFNERNQIFEMSDKDKEWQLFLEQDIYSEIEDETNPEPEKNIRDTRNQALLDDEREFNEENQMFEMSDEDREWQLFLEQDIYSVIEDETDQELERYLKESYNQILPDDDLDISQTLADGMEHQSFHEQNNFESKNEDTPRKIKREFDQSLEDAQKDFENKITEHELEGSQISDISTVTASVYGTAAGVFASSQKVEGRNGEGTSKGLREGAKGTTFESKNEDTPRKIKREFDQSLEDAQKDFENKITEHELEGSQISDISTVTASVYGTAAGVFASSQEVEGRNGKGTSKGLREGATFSGNSPNAFHDKVVGAEKKSANGSFIGNGAPDPQKKASKFRKETTQQALNDEQRDFEEHQKFGKAQNNLFNTNGSTNEKKKGSSGSASGNESFRDSQDRTFGKDKDFDFDGADIYVSSIFYGRGIGEKIGKTALRDIKKAGRYGTMYAVSAIQGNATADGLLLFGRTVGTYVLLPSAGHMVKKALRLRTRSMIKKMNESAEFAFMRDPKRMGKILKPFVKEKYGKHYKEGMEEKYLKPRKIKYILEMRKWLAKDLAERGLPADNKRKLKKLLKAGKLSERDHDAVKAYLKLSQIGRIAQKAKFTPLRNIRHLATKLTFSVKAQARRQAKKNNNHLIVGAFIASKYAKTAVKIIYRSFRSAAKAAKFLIPRAKAARRRHENSVERISTKKASGKAGKGGVRLKIARGVGGRIGKAGKALGKAATSSTERLSGGECDDAASKAEKKAAKTDAKASTKTAKAAAKVTKKAIVMIVRLTVKIISAIAALLGPIAVVAIIIFIIFFSFKSLFDLDKGTYYEAVENKTEQEKEAADVMSLQQYADILVTCRDNYKARIEKLYELEGFETINITYRDRKNNGITGFYEEAAAISNDIVTGDNIKEILTMASVLFNLNYEDYVTDGKKWGWFSEAANINRTSQKDYKKLVEFLGNNGLDPADYKDTTYQKLIRSYLIGLYNGSHPATKRIETKYCSGCVQSTEIVDIDDDGNPIYATYCPGHKHLYVSITTYYFDDIFSCELKEESDIAVILRELGSDMIFGDDGTEFESGGSMDLSGSNNIEKLWNGLTSYGFSDEAAAGAIANLMDESGGGPTDVKLNAVENGNNNQGIGMCQWSGGRKTAFLSFLASKGVPWPNENVDCQMEFMLYELNHGQWSFAEGFGYSNDCRISLEEFKQCNNLELATKAFCANFERCYEKDSHMNTKRIPYAKSVYNTFHNKQTKSFN